MSIHQSIFVQHATPPLGHTALLVNWMIGRVGLPIKNYPEWLTFMPFKPLNMDADDLQLTQPGHAEVRKGLRWNPQSTFAPVIIPVYFIVLNGSALLKKNGELTANAINTISIRFVFPKSVEWLPMSISQFFSYVSQNKSTPNLLAY
jgi:hypothetical protein